MAVCRIDINTRGSCKQKNNLSCHLSRPVWELFLFAITWQEGQFKHLFMLNEFSVVLDVQSGRKTINFLNNVAALLKRTTRHVTDKKRTCKDESEMTSWSYILMVT
jgi:hypothetical protein